MSARRLTLAVRTYKNSNVKIIVKSLLASFVAILVFVVVCFLADITLKLLFTLKNKRDFVQDLFTILFTPGVGSCIAIITVNKIFKEYNKTIVLGIFSGSFIIFTIWALSVMIPVAEKAGFGIFDFCIQIITPIVAILTAYITSKKI